MTLGLTEPLANPEYSFRIHQCYRPNERDRIVASLLAGQGLYLLGEAGIGKTALAEFVEAELRSQGFPVVLVRLATAKQIMVQIAEAFGVETENIEGKSLTTIKLQQAVSKYLENNNGFIILDNAPSVPPTVRLWLEQLYAEGQPMLLIGKTQPEKDILFKLVAMELEPMSPVGIRNIMKGRAYKVGMDLSENELARPLRGRQKAKGKSQKERLTGGLDKLSLKPLNHTFAFCLLTFDFERSEWRSQLK